MVGNIATVVGFLALIFTLLLEKVGNSLTFRLFGVVYKSLNYYLTSSAISLLKELTDVNINNDQSIDLFNTISKVNKKSIFDCVSVMEYQQSNLMIQLYF
ncbi:hypothetical protein [Acinetobacter seifertii]|uniref:hypothetical protein n=1 Tax=Acinetobacter seifertii TaxID=1530123 RepID=UPI00168ABC5E|nr:hypothetical protein [Acinetobacter seifertii]QNX87877.1 hypothetical protein IC772_01580 [Acinetobacter seifertii]